MINEQDVFNLFEGLDLSTDKVKEDTKSLVAKTKTTKKRQQAQEMEVISLFGDDVQVECKTKVGELLKKLEANAEKKAKVETDPAKILKSKKVSLVEKLAIIKENVEKVLGHQRENIIVIRDKSTLHEYMNCAFRSGRIDIDTETNNSTDPVTCELMGPCLYYPGGKQAYIPVHHVDPITGELLPNQLTEEEIGAELARILEFKQYNPYFMVIMHNGKFDYEVVYCTIGVKIRPDWDTMVAARLIDENEEAGLKKQYIKYIDPEQEKYDIEHLFTLPYKYVDPDTFALYAATDAMMTDRLYLHQLPIMTSKENERLFWVFKTIEMPIVTVTAEMELAGMKIDTEFGARLKKKYDAQLVAKDEEIAIELAKLKPEIDSWRIGPGSEEAKRFQPKKSSLSQEELEEAYPYIDKKTKRRYALTGKRAADSLSDPINLASPTQLAILFYDILKCDAPSKKSPRGTGVEELQIIADKNPNLKICQLILERRGIVKLITTYIDVIPTLATHWADNRIRFKLNSVGTDTGRYSSGGKIHWLEGDNQVEVSGINIQNIPSKNPEIRMLFEATREEGIVQAEGNDPFIIPEITEIETADGYKFAKDLVQGDMIIVDGVPVTYRGKAYNEKTRQYAILAY